MGWHVTARLAWHDSGWNGRVCKSPKKNTYCVGAHSYPGDMIARDRDVDWELSNAAMCCKQIDCALPCAYSSNAFGNETIKAYAKPPEFFNPEAERREWPVPPATVCVWPYEEMYREGVHNGPSYDAAQRKKNSDEFFKKIDEESSLIFYYANYSNPFSTDEQQRYVLIGLSRVAEVGDDLFYDGCNQYTMDRFGGYVWDRTITSKYPEQGLRLPYHLYADDPRIEQFAVFPDNPQTCKYGSLLLSDDDALGLVEQFHQAVQALINLGDTSDNWELRRKWLEELISELWQRRGAYPGMAEICCYLKLNSAVPFLKKQAQIGEDKSAAEAIWGLIEGKCKSVPGITLSATELSSSQRKWKLLEDHSQVLLKNVLCRMSIGKETIERILGAPSPEHGLFAHPSEIQTNPYLLAEQYIGDTAEDRIFWSVVDRATIPSPELGVPDLVGHDSAERLRGLAVECLTRIQGHTFVSQESLVALMNQRLESVPEWKRVKFIKKYFEVDEDAFRFALYFREEDDREYVYLRSHWNAESCIAKEIKRLVLRPVISLKIPMTDANWHDLLFKSDSQLAQKAKKQYVDAITSQVATCGKVFTRAFSVLCGAAGTGKTTVLASLIKGIRKVDGIASSVMVLAPTGKAADRAREVFEKELGDAGAVTTSTIHSLLAKKGWLNDNLTLKSHGGTQEAGQQTIIIDECSMLDLHLFETLIAAVDWSSVKRLILVGDPNQLPPIGTGRVFADIVEYCKLSAPENIAELTANLRQLETRASGASTAIIELASLYRQTSLNDEKSEATESEAEYILRKVQASGDVADDLRVMYWQEPEDLAKLLLNRLTEDMACDAGLDASSVSFYELWKNAFNWRPEYAQILSPYRGELYGIEALNLVVQNEKSSELIKTKGTLDGITLFDKVIQTRNRSSSDPIYGYNYQTKHTAEVEVFNGELGFVGPHGFDSDKWKSPRFRLSRFAVQFSRKDKIRVGYGRELGHDPRGRNAPSQNVADNLELGYAISVHKAQGSEFERVYVVIPASERQLLSQELLYTALTRAKRHCTLLVQGSVAPLINMRRRERCWLARINSSLLGWHPVPEQLLRLDGWYEAGKVHQALTGDMVRSKSEVIIANMLHERGFSFFYEKPLFAEDGSMYLPDFTLMWHGEEIYWEHVGRIDDPKYVEKWLEKKAWYEKFFPGRLRVTYERSSYAIPGAPSTSLDVSAQADSIIGSM